MSNSGTQHDSLKILGIRFSYGMLIFLIIAIYLLFNYYMGSYLIEKYYRQDIMTTLSPLYSAESLALTIFACTKFPLWKCNFFEVVRNRIDIINVLALVTAIIATVLSFSADRIISAIIYSFITAIGLGYLCYEVYIDRKKRSKGK